jgi:hypothetical protein
LPKQENLAKKFANGVVCSARQKILQRVLQALWAVVLVFFVTVEYRDSMTERTKSTILGGCLCGEFKYQLGHQLRNVNNCHCLDCRRASAAPFVTWGSIPAEDFQVMTGELKRVNFADRVRSFAACCHTPILFQDSQDSQWLDVTIVSLADPGSYSPSAEIWTDDKLPWIVLNPELPKYPQAKS